MTTITITRALSKIKILGDQINKDIKTNVFISTIPNTMLGSENHSKIVENLNSARESLQDKINQIIKLKQLVATSNLKTTIEILGKTVTVTEALAMKETMEFYNKYLQTLRRQDSVAKAQVTDTNGRISQAIASNNSDISSNDTVKNEDLEQRLALSAKQLQENMGISVVSGKDKNGDDLIKEVENNYNNFVSEIDYLLSEHNATTSIELI